MSVSHSYLLKAFDLNVDEKGMNILIYSTSIWIMRDVSNSPIISTKYL